MTAENRDAPLEDLVIGAALALTNPDDLHPIKIMKSAVAANETVKAKLEPLKFITVNYRDAIDEFSNWVMTQETALGHLEDLYNSIKHAPLEAVQAGIELQVGYEAANQLRTRIEMSLGQSKTLSSNGTFYSDIPKWNLDDVPDSLGKKAAFFVYDHIEVPYINVIAKLKAQQRDPDLEKERIARSMIFNDSNSESVVQLSLSAMRFVDHQRMLQKDAMLKDKAAIYAALTDQVYKNLGMRR